MIEDDKISEALNLEPIDVEPHDVVTIDVNTPETDFEYARSQMIDVITKGQDVLDDLLDVAKASQQPRAYEVVATMIKTIADANKDLLELSKRKKELEGPAGPSTVNNNLFVGSTTDLLKMLKKHEVDPNEQK